VRLGEFLAEPNKALSIQNKHKKALYLQTEGWQGARCIDDEHHVERTKAFRR